MTIMKPSASLDTWREYFRRGDSDIFGIIEHAIMVAATDSPEELKSRRDTIVELLFTCQVSRCIGCEQLDLSTAGDKEANHAGKIVETVGVDSGGHEEDETKLNVDKIVDEVMRIKYILLNKYDEPSVLFESLRKLASMSISVDHLKDTKIGVVVTSLRRHDSHKISKLANTLFVKWKDMVDEWRNMPKKVAEYATLSIVDEAEDFPSLPHDLDLYATHEPTALEISKILDSLDSDGNLLESVEPKHERKVQSGMMRRPEGTYEANVVEKDKKKQQMRRKEVDARPMRHSPAVFDEPKRKPKQTREQMVHTTQRKPVAGSQQDKLGLDPEAKFENSKRRLQERYQQHDEAKRQRKIQVLETIPKRRKAQRPLLKRPVQR